MDCPLLEKVDQSFSRQALIEGWIFEMFLDDSFALVKTRNLDKEFFDPEKTLETIFLRRISLFITSIMLRLFKYYLFTLAQINILSAFIWSKLRVIFQK